MAPFDPAPYLKEIDGTTVLSLNGRLAWLRHDYPGAVVVTGEKWHEPGEWATFVATVEWPGVGEEDGVPESATMPGMAFRQDGHDYYEAAARRALTHALIAFGVGTEYPSTIDGPSREATTTSVPPETGAPLTPVPQRPQNTQGGAPATQQQAPPPSTAPAPPVTDRQIGAINAISYKLGKNGADVIAECEREFGIGPSGLTKGQASRYIEMLNKQLEMVGG